MNKGVKGLGIFFTDFVPQIQRNVQELVPSETRTMFDRRPGSERSMQRGNAEVVPRYGEDDTTLAVIQGIASLTSRTSTAVVIVGGLVSKRDVREIGSDIETADTAVQMGEVERCTLHAHALTRPRTHSHALTRAHTLLHARTRSYTPVYTLTRSYTRAHVLKRPYTPSHALTRAHTFLHAQTLL